MCLGKLLEQNDTEGASDGMSDEEPNTPEMLWHGEECEKEEDPHHDVECVAPEQHSMKLILMVNRSVRNQSS